MTTYEEITQMMNRLGELRNQYPVTHPVRKAMFRAMDELTDALIEMDKLK